MSTRGQRHCSTLWYKRAASWQNQQNDYAPSEDSDQPGHPPSLIRVFAVRLKKVWALSYPLSAQRRQRMPRLIWVFAGRTVILLLLSRGGSNILPCCWTHQSQPTCRARCDLRCNESLFRCWRLHSQDDWHAHMLLILLKKIFPGSNWASSCDYGTYHIGPYKK